MPLSLEVPFSGTHRYRIDVQTAHGGMKPLEFALFGTLPDLADVASEISRWFRS